MSPTCTRCEERPARRLIIYAHGKSLADQMGPEPRCNPCTADEFAAKVDSAQKAGAVYSLNPADGSRMLNDSFLQRLISTAIKDAVSA